jgi:hypothetical protein
MRTPKMVDPITFDVMATWGRQALTLKEVFELF